MRGEGRERRQGQVKLGFFDLKSDFYIWCWRSGSEEKRREVCVKYVEYGGWGGGALRGVKGGGVGRKEDRIETKTSLS